MTPGEAVRAARQARGWTQRELGERTGLSRPAVSRIEAGSREGELGTWRRLVAVLGLDPAVVLGPLEDDIDTECDTPPPEAA